MTYPVKHVPAQTTQLVINIYKYLLCSINVELYFKGNLHKGKLKWKPMTIIHFFL